MSHRTYRQRWGLIAAIHHRAAQWLASRLGVRVYAIFVRPLDQSTGPIPDVPGFELRTFRRGDASALLRAAKLDELGLTEEFAQAAFAKGDECEAILCNGDIVSFTWTAYTPTHDHDGVFIDFGAQSRYVYFGYTAEAFRGRRLPILFKPMRDRNSRARGCTQSVSYVAVDNRSSTRLVRASGHVRVGHALYVKKGSFFAAFHTRGVRDAGVRFYVPD